jgi:hypothetical protein
MTEEKQIEKWFAINMQDFSNWTEAAQCCADALGHEEWLDDSDHVLWDIAIDFSHDV